MKRIIFSCAMPAWVRYWPAQPVLERFRCQ